MAEHASESGHDEGASHGSGSHGGGGHGHGAGGGGHEEGHEGAPEWLISFADNVALMMGFFVILLAMNMGPKADPVQGGDKSETNANTGAGRGDMIDLVIAIRESFNNKFDLNSTKPEDQPFIQRIKQRMGGPANQDSVPGKAPTVQSLGKGESAKPTAMITFDDRSTTLASDARQTLSEAAARMRGERYVIEVRGHASPFEAMRQEKAARDLSYERAMAACYALVEFGIQWEMLRPVACGASDRLVARTFDRAVDRSNQRVELIVTSEIAPPDPYSAAPGAVPGGEKR